MIFRKKHTSFQSLYCHLIRYMDSLHPHNLHDLEVESSFSKRNPLLLWDCGWYHSVHALEPNADVWRVGYEQDKDLINCTFIILPIIFQTDKILLCGILSYTNNMQAQVKTATSLLIYLRVYLDLGTVSLPLMLPAELHATAVWQKSTWGSCASLPAAPQHHPTPPPWRGMLPSPCHGETGTHESFLTHFNQNNTG